MTNSQIFKKAHATARNTVKAVGNYMVAFKLALKGTYNKFKSRKIKLELLSLIKEAKMNLKKSKPQTKAVLALEVDLDYAAEESSQSSIQDFAEKVVSCIANGSRVISKSSKKEKGLEIKTKSYTFYNKDKELLMPQFSKKGRVSIFINASVEKCQELKDKFNKKSNGIFNLEGSISVAKIDRAPTRIPSRYWNVF